MTPLLGQENSLKLQFWHRFTSKAFQNHTLLIFKIDLPFLFPSDSPSRKVGRKHPHVGSRPACCAAPKFNFSASLARPMGQCFGWENKNGEGRNSFQKTSMLINVWWCEFLMNDPQDLWELIWYLYIGILSRMWSNNVSPSTSWGLGCCKSQGIPKESSKIWGYILRHTCRCVGCSHFNGIVRSMTCKRWNRILFRRLYDIFWNISMKIYTYILCWFPKMLVWDPPQNGRRWC